MTPGQISLRPEDTNYPHPINTYLGKEAPPRLAVWGCAALWPITPNGLLALVCSAKAPAGILLAVHDLAQQWRHEPQVIISGFHSPVEQEAFEILLRGPGQIIHCPARGLPKRLKPAWQPALDAGRLTILSPFPDSVRRATKETAIYRNRFVAAMADAVLVAYAHAGSSTEQLAQEMVGWGKSIYTLDHPTNGNLIALGAHVWGT